jgi:hypothetical protein
MNWSMCGITVSAACLAGQADQNQLGVEDLLALRFWKMPFLSAFS